MIAWMSIFFTFGLLLSQAVEFKYVYQNVIIIAKASILYNILQYKLCQAMSDWHSTYPDIRLLGCTEGFLLQHTNNQFYISQHVMQLSILLLTRSQNTKTRKTREQK